jgi:ribose transport system ATP-binding protein
MGRAAREDHVRAATASAGGASVAVAGEKLTKVFAGRAALSGVDIQVLPGELHALLGANGSGKSTLVKILTGVYQPDGGTIVVGERRLAAVASPYEANALGIAVVHQEAPLIDSFTVAECIAQFRGYPTSGTRIQWQRLHREVAELLARFELRIRPAQMAGTLSAAERALVAIIIALDRVKTGLRLLVLDEVTASLPRNQAEPYLERVAGIAQSGVGVLMVTHRLAELHGRASRVTLLRDGRIVYTASSEQIDEARIVAEMVGTPAPIDVAAPTAKKGVLARLWSLRSARAEPPPNAAALELDHVSGARLRDASLAVQAGEIVGIAGLPESGVGELPLVLAGALSLRAGTVRVAGKLLPATLTPRRVIQAGMATLPADRLRSGGIPTLSLRENALLPDLLRYWHHRRRENQVLDRLVKDFDIRPPDAGTIFGRLSGGNQQKTILGKWLLLRPKVLVLDDPTNGVDPAARRTIIDIHRHPATESMAVVIYTTEP